MTVSANLDVTSMNAGLKELYDGQVVQNLVYKDNPFFALVKKNTDFVGKYKPIPIIVGTSQGRSADFATAQANITTDLVESFLLTRKRDYAVGRIDNELMEASATDKGAFLKGAKLKVDGAIRNITLSIASALFRNGTGSIGQVNASGLSTGVITLMNAADVVQFEVNMTLRCSSGATDGASVRAAKGYVIAVNRSAGTVTVSDSALGGSAGTPSGWAASEYLSVDGDLNAKCSGLAAWLPTTAPTATLFYGVNRSTDTVRLGGVRYDGSALSIEEAFVEGSSLVAREGGVPDTAFVSFGSYSALEKALGSKVNYVDLKGPADIGFRGIRINGHKGPINVIPDRNCPGNLGYLLQMDTWALEGLGDTPHILRYNDGNDMLRVATADAAEVRVAAYYNLATNAPGWNAVVQLSA
jgi:hypothetical protein